MYLVFSCYLCILCYYEFIYLSRKLNKLDLQSIGTSSRPLLTELIQILSLYHCITACLNWPEVGGACDTLQVAEAGAGQGSGVASWLPRHPGRVHQASGGTEPGVTRKQGGDTALAEGRNIFAIFDTLGQDAVRLMKEKGMLRKYNSRWEDTSPYLGLKFV